MGYFNEALSEKIVNGRIGNSVDSCVREIAESLVRHLHAFAKDVSLTQQEWEYAIDYLTRTGQICSNERQEFILLSDVLGFSMLVDALSNRLPPGATESTVFGPFYVANAPIREMGDNISLDGKGEACLFSGRILDTAGCPVVGACVDVWSDNADGFYDVQQPDIQPKWNNRGRFITASDGIYRFRGIKPVSYPIPDDGPVGQLLESLGRHPYRPAHMHYMITAPGYRRLVTHTFVSGDDYLDSDTVFGVKESLISRYKKVSRDGVIWHSEFDFILAREGE